MRFQILSSLLLLLFTSASAVAGRNQVEFSADFIQSMPQQESQQGKIYIGNEQVRTEVTVSDEAMVQIIDMKQQAAYMLDPEQQTYMEHKAGPGEMMPETAAKDANPCAGMQNLSCNKIGVEAINGRPAEKWELKSTAQEQSSQMLIWLDQERHILVRQTFPDGATYSLDE